MMRLKSVARELRTRPLFTTKWLVIDYYRLGREWIRMMPVLRRLGVWSPWGLVRKLDELGCSDAREVTPDGFMAGAQYELPVGQSSIRWWRDCFGGGYDYFIYLDDVCIAELMVCFAPHLELWPPRDNAK